MLQPRSGEPLIVAHRGASAERAEHTLAAYELALERGADGLECDIRLTRDGYLVCMHDRRVDRTSTGRGAVSRMDLAALRTYDYASWHTGTSPGDPPGGELLTLEVLLELVADWPHPVRLFVDARHPNRYGGLLERKLVTLLTRFGLTRPKDTDVSPVTFMSFSRPALRRIRAAAPAVPTVLLMYLPPTFRSGALPSYADSAGPGIHILRRNPGYATRTVARGNQLYCWTVNEPQEILLCARLGVRWICTDDPGRARALLDTFAAGQREGRSGP